MAISRNPRTISPVATGFVRDQRTSDPFVREALFGSPDTPGLIAQATQAANRVFGAPAILRETAGLDPFEQLARQQAFAGIGSYEPFLDRNLSALDRAIARSVGAGNIADPFFRREQQLIGEGADTARLAASLQFDPRFTEQFYNPFEQRVVQQTIDDVFKAGELADIDARTRDIQTGGESAFGSRARLSAADRRRALGRGLGEALSNIRSSGFQTAQQSALNEFERQARARESLSDRLSGFGSQLGGIGARRAGLARNIGADIADYGGRIGQLGVDRFDLGQRQRSELVGLGQGARDLAETRLGRQYDQAVQTRMAPLQAASAVKGFIPQYQSGYSDVRTTYGMPQDPLAAGIGTFLGTYGALSNTGQARQNPLSQIANNVYSQASGTN
jgi:hypothetical protein